MVRFFLSVEKILTAIKLEWGGGKALMALALRKGHFCGFLEKFAKTLTLAPLSEYSAVFLLYSLYFQTWGQHYIYWYSYCKSLYTYVPIS